MLPRDRWLAVVRDAPLVSIDLIVRNHANQVLLGLRSNEPACGTWFVPGGVIRKGETRAQAFERITQAELGCTASFPRARFMGVFEHHYPTNFAGAPDCGTHYIVLAYAIDYLQLPDRLPAEQHHQYSWLSEQEAAEDPKVHPYTQAYFR